MMSWQKEIRNLDERRDIAIPGDKAKTVAFCVSQFVEIAQDAVRKRGKFFAALSGGSTPSAIFQALAKSDNRHDIPWEMIRIFWSDERCVPPDHPESNYKMAMEAGLKELPISPQHIFRMKGEEAPEEAAAEYDHWIRELVPGGVFDLVMLGVGEDGHTASLFPRSHGLHASSRYAIANYVPQKHTWRLSLTFECINMARFTSLYVLGKSKAPIVKTVFSTPYDPDIYPSQRVGTVEHKALWVLDQEAASEYLKAYGK